MDTDFLIIGGGIAGVSAAASLSELGRVLLLETEAQLAHHASGRSAALYEPHYGAAPVVGLSLASGDYFHGAAGVLSRRGLMVVGGKADRAAFEEDVAAMAFQPVSLAEAKTAFPILSRDMVAFAAIADHAWDIDTDLLLQGFARAARGRGARIVTGAAVTGIARDGAGWTVTSAAGAFRAGTILNATGAWVDVVARMAGVAPLGFQPMRRSMAR
ncbi:MAG: FAD-dependent oxidoreductase, partial [Pseudomonadota bacterium]